MVVIEIVRVRLMWFSLGVLFIIWAQQCAPRVYAQEIEPRTLELAEQAGVDPEDLQGAVYTTGYDPLEYLYLVGHLERPRPTVYWPWTLIKGCETPNLGWAANTGNGFYGGLQFTSSTWWRNGGV